MRIYDLIAKKRDDNTHNREELKNIVNGLPTPGEETSSA